MNTTITRRSFLQISAAGMSALYVGFNSRGILSAAENAAALNPFVKINADGTITVIIKHFEMGQGTTTGLATLIAEEMDADWEKVHVEFAPSDPERYKNLFFGMQGTGGSTAIANSYMQYRTAGAGAREILVKAAAQKWGVAANTVRIEKSMLRQGTKQAHFGELIETARGITPSDKPALKQAADFKLIGNPDLERKDNRSKTNGTAVFAIDVFVPGMLNVVILRSPKFGGTLQRFDSAQAKKVEGFVDAKALPNNAGVAVYAKNTWAAIEARKAIQATWDFSNAETNSTAELVAIHRDLAAKPRYQVDKAHPTDKMKAVVAGADTQISADFTFPYLAHAPMEPLGCVIEPTKDGVTLHDGSQFPTMTHGALAKVLGLPQEKITINTVYAGGSFGRRATPTVDYQVEAAMAFALLGGKTPIKLTWTREDDIRGGYYRPMIVHQATIGLDKQGAIRGWDHRVAGKSIMKGTPFESFIIKDGIDSSMVEGIHSNVYQIPNMAIGLSYYESPLPVLWWRSVEHTHTAFVMESLLDMVAHQRNEDPIAMRLAMLTQDEPKQKRLSGVLKAVRDLSGWKTNDKRGVAAHFSFNTYVAAVAEISLNGNQIHVDRLYFAVDCGVAINPDVIKAQVEGAAGYALGAMLRNEINLKNGEVVESNFPDYEPLRISDMPKIEVVIVPSGEAPTGIGEPAVPPTAPAITNAIFAASGKRVTNLPLTKAGFEIV